MQNITTSKMEARPLTCVCFLMLLMGLSAAGQQCLSQDYKYYGIFTEFETSRHTEPVTPDPTCEPLAIWALNRHAFRYDRVTDQEQKLSTVRDAIIANTGSLCQETRDALSSWMMKMTAADDMKQSESGWGELRGVGSRLKNRYPTLFSTYDETKHALRYSNTSNDGDRTGDSARAWAEGAFNSYEGVKIVESGSPDWLLRFYRDCDRYRQEVGDAEETSAERDKFREGPEMTEAISDTNELLGLPENYLDYDLLFQMYQMCRLEQGIYGSSPWCGVLTTDVLKVLEFEEDVYWYHRDSYAHAINYEMSCSLMVDVLDHLSSIENGEDGYKVISNIGHLPTQNGFYALLGLFKDEEDLKADAFERQADRKYRNSLTTQMAANIVFVLSSCSSGHVVEAFINEGPIAIPGCSNIKCPYDEIVTLWQPIADGCDIEEICKIDDTSSTPAMYHPNIMFLLTMITAFLRCVLS